MERSRDCIRICVVSSVLCYIVLFFFFKQKTAYEMRISDWSSDVCSSDLAIPPDRHETLIADKDAYLPAFRRRVAAAFLADATRAAFGRAAAAAPPLWPPLRAGALFCGTPRPLPFFLPPWSILFTEIGRAHV